jgi:hypothetical protein
MLKDKFTAENRRFDDGKLDLDGLGGLFGEAYDKDPVTKEEFESGRWAIIPKEVIDFIESHIHRDAFAGKNFKGMKNFDPLTTNWNFGMRSSMIEKGLVRRYGYNNNMELPDKSMDSIETMLNDTSFFNYQRGDIDSLAADCKDSDIYHLPMRPVQPRVGDAPLQRLPDQHDYSKLTCAVDIVNNWGKVGAAADDRLDMISDRRLAMVPDPEPDRRLAMVPEPEPDRRPAMVPEPEPDRLYQVPTKKVGQKKTPRWAKDLEWRLNK